MHEALCHDNLGIKAEAPAVYFVGFLMVVAGDGPEAVAALLQEQLAVLAEGGVTTAELARVQREVRAGLLASAQSNSAMASSLASYRVSTGRRYIGIVE